MPTARDVAKLAGTSSAVVSYVFNNGPRNVSALLRRRVLDAAAELDYQPNALARALSFGKTSSIGLIVPDISNPYFGELARALENAALAKGNLLLIGDSGLEPDRESRIAHAFVERRVDSVVMVSLHDSPDFRVFQRASIPVVALHPTSLDSGVSSLTIDYEAAARDAAAHLLAHGYLSLGLLNPPEDSIGAVEHSAGFTRAVDEAAEPVTTTVRHSDISREAAAEVGLSWFSQPDRPRAVTCATDEQAFGLLFAAYSLKLRVPEDIAIMGFDATTHSPFSVPPLASVRQPIDQLAARAIELLTGAGRLPVHERLDHALVPRASCGCTGDAQH